MHHGHCTWHQGPADDVALIVVHEQGSGPGGGEYACLPCAARLPLTHYGQAAFEAIASLKERAASGKDGTGPA
ncbi:hypothetical protein ACTWQF_26435 [Streptomyces sp. 8N114]|uniref:hypothetical protein n=1 Tax=Streptomyces sp. 8N114 TaxID=3457419 RepID=UPI003FD286C0